MHDIVISLFCRAREGEREGEFGEREGELGKNPPTPPIPAVPILPRMALTQKQKKFCEEYLVDLNGTAAYIRAGYSPKRLAASTHASRLLRKPGVVEYIRTLRREQSGRTKITADRVLRELACMAFSDVRRLHDSSGEPIPVQDLDDDTAAAVQSCAGAVRKESEVTICVFRYRLYDKKGALELLGKHLGLFSDRQQFQDTDIRITIVTPQEKESG